MKEHLTISSAPLEHPGMNFALLRQEGIQHIERLAGNIWTDYNSHDPGITLLEHLCYAITDLSYRLGFEIEDLLTYQKTEDTPPKQFYTAREILTTNPLTINDYRKLLIDLDGVKNAWLEPFSSDDEQININGLYKVTIEKEPKTDDEVELKSQVRTKLNQYRNLCEDFQQIEILPREEIYISTEIEIKEGFDHNQLMAQLYCTLDNFISPSIQFSSLTDLIAQGQPIETIFNSPLLDKGFIDDEQLQRLERKTALYTSDLIRIILEIEGIKNIKELRISKQSSEEENWEDWVLALDPNKIPKLEPIESLLDSNKIYLYQGQAKLSHDQEQVTKNLESLQNKANPTPPTSAAKDIFIPSGEYRELSDYVSIQSDLPENYGVGEVGLPQSASSRRKAQAKQLKAYLMIFDQILANYLAQLDYAKNLLELSGNQTEPSYASQLLTDIEAAAALKLREILAESYNQEKLAELTETEETQLARRNRFLNYLIAQFGEKFTDASLLYGDSDPREELIAAKQAFLANYLQISRDRGKAFNYTISADAKNPENSSSNISGLKQRISALLDLPVKEFELIEHILLRPHNLDNLGNNQNSDPYSCQISCVFLDKEKQPDNFKQLVANTLLAETPAHITPYLHWLNQGEMTSFQEKYEIWLTALKTDPSSSETLNAAQALMGLLAIGELKLS
ncbi:MAG: hypothetical protein F6K21_24495 [Symploca sp. SIO2D2]|nr:hypothetical protein [Symploca sp. SIO2D2]